MDLIWTLDYDMPNTNSLPTPPSSRSASNSAEEESEEDRDLSNEAPDENTKKKVVYKQMIELDKTVLNLLQQAETQSVIPLVPGGEEEVVRNQQLAASMVLAV
jgi:hypothetical protein